MASEECNTICKTSSIASITTTTTTNTTQYCSNSNAGSLPGSLGRDYRCKSSNLSTEIQSDDDDDDDDEKLNDSKSIRTIQAANTLERHKSDRNLSSNKPAQEEDRRRRTIIIEKKNSSYGFTLQTYGIHYRKEQEIEMITYVDYVEYDGPAYKAGMREGDVILSINGIDMEKADHKTLVELIKKCDTRMRMVVLFEDCVRKVALHMRYIHLQNNLQNKINELERACLQERQLLTGKWKTHSLPARKKTINSSTFNNNLNQPLHQQQQSHQNGGANNKNNCNLYNGDCQPTIIYRPAISTEDVVNIGHSSRYMQQQQSQPQQQQQQQQSVLIPPPDQFIVAYQYLDPNYRYVLKPSTSNSSGEYFISVGPQRSPSECHYILTRDGSTTIPQLTTMPSTTTTTTVLPCCDHDYNEQQQQDQQQQQQRSTASGLPQKLENNRNSRKLSTNNGGNTTTTNQKSFCHGHSCNPCLGNFGKKSIDKNNMEDNTSLEAYDLASSPCCATHCVPTRRRSSRNSKEHHHHHKHKHRDKESKERPRPRSQSHASPEANHHHHHHHHNNNNNNGQPQQQPQQQKHTNHSGQSRSKYLNLSANLASHCSLHSCTSSEFAAPAESSAASYSTSLSTDTLYWDPQSEGNNSRQLSTKSRQSYYPGGSVTTLTPASTATSKGPQLVQQKGFNQPQTTNIYQSQLQQVQQPRYCMHPPNPNQQIYQTPICVQKPKSWDNLTTKAFGGYGFGYGYLDTIGPKPLTTTKQHSVDNNCSNPNTINNGGQQHRHSIPRKNPYGRYSTYTDVENYAPPPSQFVEEISTLTTVFVKKTEQMVTEKSLPPPKPQTQTQSQTQTQPVSGGSGSGSGSGSNTIQKLHKNNSHNNLTNLINKK